MKAFRFVASLMGLGLSVGMLMAFSPLPAMGTRCLFCDALQNVYMQEGGNQYKAHGVDFATPPWASVGGWFCSSTWHSELEAGWINLDATDSSHDDCWIP